MMRHYRTDSPEAAARIVALAMLADGHLDRTELSRAEELGVYVQLGLDRVRWHSVLYGFCEDLMTSMSLNWGALCQVDPQILLDLLSEVRDPALRERVLDLCLKVTEADGHLADGESTLLATAASVWKLPLPDTAPA
jgi:tellurite resistance protein